MFKHSEFPSQIGQYVYKSAFSGDNYSGDYNLGLYADSRGEIYFVKRWSGKSKDLAYKWLKNEAIIYRELSGRINELNIHTPKFIDLIENKNSLTLFMEYIQGDDLGSVNTNVRASIYCRIIKFLSISKLNIKINSRPSYYWLMLTPIISLYAIYQFPQYYKDIFRGLVNVMKHSFNVIKHNDQSLVHRDLNDHNVILKKNKVYLIDFELAITADSIIDIAILLLKHNNDPDLIKSLIQDSTIKERYHNTFTKNVLTAYMTIFSLYDLCFENGLHSASIRHLQGLIHEK